MTARFMSRPSRDTVQVLAYLDDVRARAIALTEARSAARAPSLKINALDASVKQPPNQWFQVRLFDRQEVQRTLALYDSREQRAARSFLTDLSKLPEVRTVRPPPSVAAVRSLAERFPNFAKLTALVEVMTVLARAWPGSPLELPPLLLVGPPGVGKTAFSIALAETIGVDWSLLGMSHATAGFDLGGLDSGYGGGGPGLLTRQVALSEHPDRVVVLDEIDKPQTHLSSDPLGPLYQLLEPSTARRFRDDGIKVQIDMSCIKWIATANDLQRIDPALRSRFTVFHISPPTPEQAAVIVQNIYVDLLESKAWGFRFSVRLRADVLHALSDRTPREVKSALMTGCARALQAGRNHLRLEDLDPPPPAPRRIGFN